MPYETTGGWIKIYRCISKHWIWENPIYLKGWITIILTVNYEDKKTLVGSQLLECKRGQSLLSLQSWVKVLGKGWTIKKVRTFFSLLENDNMIVTQGTSQTTRLTVCKYDEYQDQGQASDTQGDTQRADEGQAKGKQRATTKEGEEGEEGKEERKSRKKVSTPAFIPPSLDEVKVYFKENGYTEAAAIKAFTYYEAMNWHDSNNNQVKNWKTKMVNVWFKEENKIKKPSIFG